MSKAPTVSSDRTRLFTIVLGLIIVVITFLCFFPALDGPFIWDDGNMVFRHPFIKAGASDGLAQFWYSKANFDYFPLTSTSLWLEWRMFGMDATGYRVINVLLHALAAILIWRIMRRLKIPAAWLIGLIFAIHPVGVASAAWIAERKNTLCMLFYASSLLLYLRFEDGRLAGETRKRWYVLSFITFVAALLSKTHAVVLPIVILLIVWWKQKRVTLKHLVHTLPYFVCSLVIGVIALHFQYHKAIGGAIVRQEGLLSKIAGTGWCLWFYVQKALLPFNLMLINPRWEIRADFAEHWAPLFLAISCFSLVWLHRKGWGRAALAGFGYHAITLLPVLGLLNIYFMRFSLVADHWHYFSYIGPVAVVVGGIATLCLKRGGRWPVVGIVAGGIVVIVLCVSSFIRSGLYGNEKELWRDSLIRNDQAWNAWYSLGTLYPIGTEDQQICMEEALVLNENYYEAHHQLGLTLRAQGMFDEAMIHFMEAITLRPDYFEAQNALGETYMLQGRFREAVPYFENALNTFGAYAVAHLNLGIAFTVSGDHKEGLESIQKAVSIGVHPADAHSSLAETWLRLGKRDRARQQFELSLRVSPNVRAYVGMGMLADQEGSVQKAYDHYAKALEIDPMSVDVNLRLAELLFQVGQYKPASMHYTAVMKLNPEFGIAWFGLGNCFMGLGEIEKAIKQFEETVASFPDYLDAYQNLAVALTTVGRYDEAEARFIHVLKLNPDMLKAHYGLAATLTKKGEIDGAIAIYESLVESDPDDTMAMMGLAPLLAAHPMPEARNAVRAIALVEKAVELTKGADVSCHEAAARVYMLVGRMADASESFDRAISLAERRGQSNEARRLRAAKLRTERK